MGCFYVGFDYKNRKNGYFKIGETSGKSPAQRLAVIRQYDSFQLLGYLVFEDDTKPQRLFVESYVRMKLAEQYEHTQNDHFLYNITPGAKYEQAEAIASMAMRYAEEACKFGNIPYHIGTKQYKRG